MTIEPEAIELFSSSLRGSVIRESMEEYDEARRIWNAMVDRKPTMIARCGGTQDVARAVSFARDHGLPLSVRGGGHSAAGNAICESGLVIDLSGMKDVRVDSKAGRAWAEGGATWRDLDSATQAYGQATTGGVVSSTGVAGLTLGGGFGILMRKHGLACDNLIAAEVVTADGDVRRASEEDDPDLLWALRGGGGNFGVVTSLTYRVHPVERILWGPIIYPVDRAASVLRHYLQHMAEASDELQAYAGFLFGPDGSPVFAVVPAWVGSIDDGLRALRPLREFGQPVADMVEEVAYMDHRALFDAAYPPGFRNYWKANMLDTLTDDTIDRLARRFTEAASSTGGTGIALEALGGAVARVGESDTAFAHRGAAFSVLVTASWNDPARDEANREWVRGVWDELSDVGPEGVYVNYMQSDEEEGDARVRAAYGVNHARLTSLKAKYDPENLFRQNQNIRPG